MAYDNFTDELKAQLNIVDIIGREVTLKKSGSNYMGLCPFHSEKTPSFSVNEGKQFYHCFGCGKSGDVIGFVQEYYRLPFVEAVEKLATENGIKLPERRSSGPKIDYDKYHGINAKAARFFYNSLGTRGNKGLAYLKKRGLSKETITSFGLGYAPASGHALVDHLRKEGVSDEDMLKLGLANKGKDGLYETLMKQSMEEFFAIEPFKTFRERFNVYAVKVVSPNGWTGSGYETALGAVFTHGSSSSGVLDKCFEYALKVPEIKDGKNLMISVLVNSRNAGGITNMIESSQSGVAFTSSEGNNPESFGMILRHEAGGHAFAFLDDEYFNIQTEPTADHIAHRKSMYEKYGWYANIDFTNDPKKVKWSAFLTDERYKDEVGIFEGGSLYARNAYRPTNHSMMNDHFEYFNAPSRWAIYKRIMELSGEEASFEKFLEYDAINLGKKQANSAPRTRSDIKIEHTPPVIIP